MQFPGVLWTVILVALPMLSAWLEQYFGAAEWALPVAGLLLIIAKTVEIVKDKPAPLPEGVAGSDAPDAQPGQLKRWLVG